MLNNECIIPEEDTQSIIGFSKFSFLLREPISGEKKEYIENIINYYINTDPFSTPHIAIYFLDFLQHNNPYDESFMLFANFYLNNDNRSCDGFFISSDDEDCWDISLHELSDICDNFQFSIINVIEWKFGTEVLDRFNEWILDNQSSNQRRDIKLAE